METEWVVTDEIVELNGGDTLIDARNDLLRDGCCINVFGIKTIAQSGDTSRDLVELNAFFASICTICQSGTRYACIRTLEGHRRSHEVFGYEERRSYLA